jgi:hypothetical protein
MQAVVVGAELLRVIGMRVEAVELSCLGDVLRAQEYASLYLSTQTQIKDLAWPVQSRNVKGEMSDWRFLSLQIDHAEQSGLQILLIGDRGPNGIVTTTSPVMAVDLDEGLVKTMNSVYRLRMDARGVGEPSLKQLICLCQTFHSWGGLGRAFNVPRI